MKTIDGKLNSAVKIIEVLQKKVRGNMHEELSAKTLFKYKILNIRSKISFMALQKRMTITELFITTIIKIAKDYLRDGVMKGGLSKERNMEVEKMVQTNFANCRLNHIIKLNEEVC